jgi:hypothetical protein
MGRGRPRIQTEETKPTKFTREYTDSDGIRCVWKYDLDIFLNGPISTTMYYPQNYKPGWLKLEEANKKVPKSQRRYENPSNGKLVGYQRAKQLGII